MLNFFAVVTYKSMWSTKVQRLIIYGPKPSSVFVNNVLLGHSHTHSLKSICGYFHTTKAEFSSCSRDGTTHKFWNIYYLALSISKVTNNLIFTDERIEARDVNQIGKAELEPWVFFKAFFSWGFVHARTLLAPLTLCSFKSFLPKPR